MKKFLSMLIVVWLAVFFSNFSYAENGITYNDNLTTRTDLNWNEFQYWTITVEYSWDSITLMDRNLWATTNDITSTWSYGYHYQWWNNYWFLSKWTNSANFPNWEEAVIDLVQRNPSYDNNWYYWVNFIKHNNDKQLITIDYRLWWDNEHHNNIWWWSWDNNTN